MYRRVKNWNLTAGLVDRTSTFVTATFIVVLWEGYARFTPQGNNYFPSVGYTIQQTGANVDVVLTAIHVTFMEAVSAFLLATLVGVVLGIVLSESFIARQMSMPLVVLIYSIPHAILAPLFMVWFGTGFAGVVVFGAWVAFFPVFINTMTGMSQIDEEFRHLGHLIGATRWQMLRYIKFWSALPNIASSVRVAVQLSIVGVIIAEFLATGSGLGHLIISSTQRAQLGLTFGAVITIMFVALAFYKLVDLTMVIVMPEP